MLRGFCIPGNTKPRATKPCDPFPPRNIVLDLSYNNCCSLSSNCYTFEHQKKKIFHVLIMIPSARNTVVKFSQNEAQSTPDLENNWHFQLIPSEDKKSGFGTGI